MRAGVRAAVDQPSCWLGGVPPAGRLGSLQQSPPCPLPRSLLMFTMENCFYLLISQAVRYLRDPAVHPRDKQRMKQELSSELVQMDRGLGLEGGG